MDVELYVGYGSHRWDTTIIEIPEDTPADQVESVAIDIGQNLLFNNPNTEDEVAFVGVYSIL